MRRDNAQVEQIGEFEDISWYVSGGAASYDVAVLQATSIRCVGDCCL